MSATDGFVGKILSSSCWISSGVGKVAVLFLDIRILHVSRSLEYLGGR